MKSGEKKNSKISRNSLMPFLRKERSVHDNFFSQLSRLEDVKVSTTVISFHCRGNHSQYQYNRDLRITNNTGLKISFSIKSNNPENYEVIPCREHLDDGKSCQIRIRIALDNKNASKYNLDKFLLQWGKYQDNPSNIEYLESLQLKVRVENESITQKQADASHKEEQDLLLYQEMLKKNRQKLSTLDSSIEVLKLEPDFFVVSKPLMAILAALSFLIGYLIA